MLVPPHTPRTTTSAFYQLKLSHGYFKSYLAKRDKSSDLCSCGAKQTPKHLLLSCKWYKEDRKELKETLKARLSLKLLLHTKKGVEGTLGFLRKTGICTRKWILGIEE